MAWRVNYSNVMSTLAVFLVVAGGSALAAAMPKNSVTSKAVKNGSLKSADLKDGKAVKGADVDPSEVQLRVRGSCAAGEAVRSIEVRGSVECEAAGGRPSGPAGGSLAGEYPDPTLAQSSVVSATVGDDSLSGADVDEARLGTVPSARDADQLGGAPAASYQRRVSGNCTLGRAILGVNPDGSVRCAENLVRPVIKNMVQGSSFFNGQAPVPAAFTGTCNPGGTTQFGFVNLGDQVATLNWSLSRGGTSSTVEATGVTLAPSDSIDFPYGTTNRIEGQFIFNHGDQVATFNLHAFEGASSCEVLGTATYAQAQEG